MRLSAQMPLEVAEVGARGIVPGANISIDHRPRAAQQWARRTWPLVATVVPDYHGGMFEIPENLPLRLSALAWLIGRWQGWGMLVAQNPEGQPEEQAQEDSPIIQDIDAKVIGEQLRMVVSIYHATSDVEVDPLWTAQEGLDHLTAGDLVSEETLYWSVDSPLAVLPVDPDQPRELRATSSDTNGFAVLWAGVAMGPRIRLASDGVARTPTAAPVDHFSRMFGLVAGELMWASEVQIGDADFEVEHSGRLLRASNQPDESAGQQEADSDE